MRPLRWLPALSIAAALLSVATRPAPAQAPCPLDSLRAQSKATVFGDVATRRARVDTTFQDGCGPALVAYDLGAGTLASEIDFTCGGGSTSTSAWDDYTVLGPETGTPVSFRIELEADLQVLRVPPTYSRVGGYALLSAGDASRSMESYQSSRQEVLRLDVTRDAGIPFRVNERFLLSAWIDGGRARLAGTLRFVGLPGGSRIESCQGFRGAVLPARLARWGDLKAIYR